MWAIEVVKELPEIDSSISSLIPCKWFKDGMCIIYGTRYGSIKLERILSALLTAIIEAKSIRPIQFSELKAVLYRVKSHSLLQDPEFDNYVGELQKGGDIELVRLGDIIYIIPLQGLVSTVVTSRSLQDHTSMDT